MGNSGCSPQGPEGISSCRCEKRPPSSREQGSIQASRLSERDAPLFGLPPNADQLPVDTLVQSVPLGAYNNESRGSEALDDTRCPTPSSLSRSASDYRHARDEDSGQGYTGGTGVQSASSDPFESSECRTRSYFDRDLGEGPDMQMHVHGPMRQRRWYRFRSQATYDGEWLGGVRDGVGRQVWPNGAEYMGQWQRGRASGRGYMKHADGDTYCGEWQEGRAHGQGVYAFHLGPAVYEGRFKRDLRDGSGVERWMDGSVYAGEYRAGAKHGVGEQRWPDGTTYDGTWISNEIHGYGRYTLRSGATYEGQWQSSVIHGIGKYTWPSGKVYEGQYSHDVKQGFGVLCLQSGKRQPGFWDRGKPITSHKALS